jgi:hypothetical protein
MLSCFGGPQSIDSRGLLGTTLLGWRRKRKAQAVA